MWNPNDFAEIMSACLLITLDRRGKSETLVDVGAPSCTTTLLARVLSSTVVNLQRRSPTPALTSMLQSARPMVFMTDFYIM